MSHDDDKKFTTPLVWMDMEMTGLDPAVDHILEVAVLVTDGDLNVLAEGPAYAVHQPESVLAAMGQWCKDCHGKSGLLDRVRSSKISVAQAECDILDFLKPFCVPKSSPLCGNSIEQDRRFIHAYMPALDAFLHYRHVNVSSFKEMVRRWYPQHPKREFPKAKKHLALDDIHESLAELKHYRQHFFVE